MNKIIAVKELTLTRILNAPAKVVFKVWTEPKHLAQWWGPKDFTNPVCGLDSQPGGIIRIDMRAPDGEYYAVMGNFKEIIAPVKLVFTIKAFPDDDGNAGLEVQYTVLFTEHDCMTELVLYAAVVKATSGVEAAVASMDEEWNQSMERLADTLAEVQNNETTYTDHY